jgi:pilus assembly protein CpaC
MFEVFAGEPHLSRLTIRRRKPLPNGGAGHSAGRSLFGCNDGRRWPLCTMLAYAASYLACGAVPAAPAQERGPGPQAAPAEIRLPDQISAMPTISQSLDVVQHRSQLLIGRSNIVRSAVADPSIIEVAHYSPNELAIIGLQVGTTTLTLWFDKSREPLIYLVNTVRDPSVDERRRTDFAKLERKLALLFPNSKVYLIPFSGKIVVKGQAHDSEEAATILQIIRGEVGASWGTSSAPAIRPASGCTACQQASGKPSDPPGDVLVNMLEIPGEFQVMLRVRIAELDRSQLRRMGLDLTHLLFDGRHWAPGGKGRSSASAGIFENGEIKSVLNGLMANGTAKILSEPVLTVVSGHSASFLSGGEFAVPNVVGVDGISGKQTTFHNFGTSLVVTPVVLDRDLIRMNIVPEFSQLNSGNTVDGIPGIDTRRAETTVQLREGQTIVLAGLISHRMTTETSHIRFLGDLPILGPKYFSGKRSKQDETELLILVTPEIVRPMDADEVPPVPGHEVTAPNDCELYRCGMTEGAADPAVYQLPPFGAGHSAGVPVGYHLFEQQGGMAPPSPIVTGPPAAPIPASGPYSPPPPAPAATTQITPAPEMPTYPAPAPPVVSPAPVSPTPAATFTAASPAPVRTAQQPPNWPQSFAPIDEGLDAPGPIGMAAPKTAGAVVPTTASNQIRQTSAWMPQRPSPSATNNPNSVPSWSQRPVRSVSNTQATPQRPDDGPTIIPGPISAAPPTDSSVPASKP